MPVYLDPIVPALIRTRTGYVDGCTMWADERGELEQMAIKAGISLRWIKRSGSGMHYFQITIPFRARARAAGAVCLSEREAGKRHAERWPRREVYKNLQMVRA